VHNPSSGAHAQLVQPRAVHRSSKYCSLHSCSIPARCTAVRFMLAAQLFDSCAKHATRRRRCSQADDETLGQMLSFGKDVLAQVVDENRRR
jgi:hypothetical protein